MDDKLIGAVCSSNLAQIRELLPECNNFNEVFPFLYSRECCPEPATLLIVAAHSELSSPEVMEMILAAGASVDQSLMNIGTALCLACAAGKVEKVKLLIQHGADVWPKKQVGRNFLLSPEEEASRIAKASKWQAGESGNQPDRTVPLFMAAKSGSVECVKLIVERGFPVAFQNGERTALDVAGSSDVIQFLVRAGLILRHDQDELFDSQIHQALANGRWDLAQLFIETLTSEERLVVLTQKLIMFCGFSDFSFGAVKRLVEWGADPNGGKEEMGNALHWCAWQGTGDEILFEDDLYHAMEFFIALGVDTNLRNPEGKTPLHEAVYGDWGNPTAAYVLTLHGADVNAQDHFGNTPLLLASERGELLCVQILLENGADKTIANYEGETPLSNAHRYLRWREESGKSADIEKARKVVELLQ